jgi:hypothetical protein
MRVGKNWKQFAQTPDGVRSVFAKKGASLRLVLTLLPEGRLTFLMTENLFGLANFSLRGSGNLLAHAFGFHIWILAGMTHDLFGFSFGLAAHAFCSVSDAAFHTISFDERI